MNRPVCNDNYADYRFLPLLWRSLLSGLIATIVLFAFHYLMRQVSWLYRYPWFETPEGGALYFFILLLLCLLQLFAITCMRDRNESADVLSTFVSVGVKVEYGKDVGLVFLCCLCSFASGFALGAEAPSVFMSCLIFGGVFDLLYHSKAMSKSGIRIGGAIGFALAFQNPLAGLANSFAGNIFARSYKKGEWRVVCSSLLAVLFCYLLYSCLKLLVYQADYGPDWFRAFLWNDYSFSLSQFGFASLSSCFWLFLLPLITFPLAYIYVKAASFFRDWLWRDNALSYWLSLIIGVLFCFLLAMFLPSALGTGANYFEVEGYLQMAMGPLLLLLFLRLLFTFFSFSSHFSGGNIIPTLGIGALIGIVLARVFPVEGYEQLFAMSFALSFFGFVTFNPLLSLSLVFSFGFSPALFIVLLPTAILPFLGFNRIRGFSSLSRSLASKDIGHRSYAASRFLLFPYSSSIAILRLASRAPLIEGGKGVD